MNKFVKLICLFAAVFSLALSGCGAESVELSDEDAKKVAIKYEVFDFSDLDEIDCVDEGKEYREENDIPETVYDGHNYVFTILTRDAFRPAIRFHIGNDAYQKFDIMRTISEIIEKNGRASKDAASWWNETNTDKRL